MKQNILLHSYTQLCKLSGYTGLVFSSVVWYNAISVCPKCNLKIYSNLKIAFQVQFITLVYIVTIHLKLSSKTLPKTSSTASYTDHSGSSTKVTLNHTKKSTENYILTNVFSDAPLVIILGKSLL